MIAATEPASAPRERPRIAIAGASGFVGEALLDRLSSRFRIIGLTRSPARAAEPDHRDGVEWRHCDLFSVNQITAAIEGCEFAVYLVHSMMPSSRLTQANFIDLDLLLADNYARSCEAVGVRQILYVGGLMPSGGGLSDHLASRLEVENTLASRGVPVTALRAGLIVGPGGSSTRILVNLVKRLAVMGLPKWCHSSTHPIALRDLVQAVEETLGHEEAIDQQYDVGGRDVLTYRQMLEITAEELGVQRRMFNLPFIPPWFSLYWVQYISGSPQALVAPLVKSLKHAMVARDNPLLRRLQPEALGFREALRASLNESHTDLAPNPRRRIRRQDDQELRRAKHVRSVQRMPLPPGRDARWVAREYMRWLPQFVWPLMHCETDDVVVRFKLKALDIVLLEMKLAPDWSRSDRQVFFITGGWLAETRHNKRGRFEFREVLGGTMLIAAIHDYQPRLPWYFYIFTQAHVHMWVMNAFRRHLARMAPPEAESVPKFSAA
ncbi:MAG: NAD(P)H-binding protein [Verrucomicrobiota bacterium]